MAILSQIIQNNFIKMRNRLDELILTRLPDFRETTFQKFINDLGITFMYRIIGSVFSSVVVILAANSLGPVQYGHIGLVNNIANILLLPVMVGINSSMYKYLPDSSQNECDQYKTTALTGNVVFLIIFSLVYCIISNLG